MKYEAMQFWPIILRNANLPWRTVLSLGSKVSFGKNTLVGCQFAPDGVFYYIQKGLVRLSYPATTGNDKVIYYLGENTIFNELPASTKAKLCNFTCVENVQATAFDINLVRSHKFIREYPDIILNLLDSSMQKGALYYHQLTSLGAYPAFNNVCRLLYSMCLHNKRGAKIVPQLNKKDFASIISIHRGSLHKCLSRLTEEGIIGKFSKNELVVYDVERLKEYAIATN